MSSSDPEFDLGKSLIDRGVLSPESLRVALARKAESESVGSERSLSEVLLEMGVVTSEDLAGASGEVGALRCPSCSAVLSLGAFSAGARVRCPHCKKALQISPDRSALHILQSTSASPVLKKVTRSCPECSVAISFLPSDEGTEVSCPGCRSILRASSSEGDLVVVEKFVDGLDSSTDLLATLPAQKPPRKGVVPPRRNRIRKGARRSGGTGGTILRRRSGEVGKKHNPSLPTAGQAFRKGSTDGAEGSTDGAGVAGQEATRLEGADAKIGKMLIDRGFLSELQWKEGLKQAEKDRSQGRVMPMVHYLLRNQWIATEDLRQVLSEESGSSTGGGSSGSGSSLKERLRRRSNPLRERVDGGLFGGFEILEEIGKGGMGAVYKVHDPVHGQVLALKVLLEGENEGGNSVHHERFRKEIAAIEQLRHRNIVSLHGSGVEEGFHYYTMDYIEGPTLKAVLKQGVYNLRSLLEILVRLLSAIAHAHRQGLLHRDIKPSNIIIDASGEPCLTDFGLAKNLDTETQLTRTGAILGTPHYMAPEQISGKHELGPFSDLYSFGVLLYEICTGELPFQAESSIQLYQKILTDHPIPPSHLDPEIDRSLESICLKAMSRSPQERYKSAMEFASDLRNYLRGDAVKIRRSFPWKRWIEQWSRSPVAWGGVLLLLLLLGIGIGSFFDGGRSSDGEEQAQAQQERAERAWERARNLALRGQHAQALAHFDESLEAAGGFVPSRIGKARSQLALERFGDVLDTLDGFEIPEEHGGEVFLLKGKALLGLDRGDEAIGMLGRAISANPEDPAAYQLRAKAYLGLGDNDRFLQDRLVARKLLRKSSETELSAIRDLMGKKEFPAALERVQAILEGDPDHHEALYLEYQVRLELKDLNGALEVISRAITRGGGRPEYRIERARLFAQLGHEEAAEKDLDWLEGKGFMIGEVSAVRGEIAVDRGNMARAVDWFQRAEANQYTQPDLYLARARAYLSQKRYGRSIEDLDRVFRQKNLSLSIQAEASYVRGRARTEEGRELSSAREDLEAAGAMGYDASGMDQYFLGRIDLKEGKPKPARERFEALVRSGMTHPQIRYFLAQSYFELGNVKESHRVVTEAIHQSPFQARFFRLRGKCRLQLEQFEGAEEDLDKALALDVEDFEPLVGLFFSYIGQGRFDRCLDMQGLVNNLYGRGWNEPVSLFDPRSTDFLSRYVEGYVFEQPRVKLLKGEAEARKLYARYVWALESSDKTVRQAAIGALRGAGEVMVPLLEQQREEASQELQKVLDEALDGIEEDRRARLRHELSARLVKFYIGRDASSFEFLEKGGKSVIDRLDSLFLDTTEERVLRDLAARALLDLRMPTAFAKLVSACGSKDPFVAIVATDYMYGAGFASSFQRLLSFFEDKDPRIRALAVQRTPFMPSEVQRWRDRLQDADHRVRVQAARRLALRGDRSGISALMQSLKSNETEVRRVGIRGLGHLKGKDSVAALSVMIEDDEPSLRRDAVVALSQQGISNAVGLMKLVERETRNDIRAMALLAIARTKDKRARSMMHEILFNDEANVIERGAALLYFSATNDFLVVGELPQLLQSRDRLARMVALFSMGMYTRDFAKGKIIENLKHEDSAIRAAAATSLAYCSGDDVRDALWKRVDDPSVIVASVAAGSLTYLFYQKGIEFPDLFERLKSKPWYVRRGTGFGLHRLATIHPKNISAKSAKEREAIRRQILTRALDWIPEMPELYRDLSLSLRGAGEVDQALRVLGRGLRKHPDEIDLLFERGQAYFSKKDWSRALEDFQRVTEVDRKRVDAWFYAGEAERKRNRYASAIDHYDKVFFLRPSHAAALTRQAEMLRLLKRDDAVRWTDLHGMSHRYLSWGRLHWEVARHRARKKMVNDCLFHLEQAKKGNVDVGKAATLPEFSFLVSDSNFQRLTK